MVRPCETLAKYTLCTRCPPRWQQAAHWLCVPGLVRALLTSWQARRWCERIFDQRSGLGDGSAAAAAQAADKLCPLPWAARCTGAAAPALSRGLPVATSHQQAPGLVGGLLVACCYLPQSSGWGAGLRWPGKADGFRAGWPHGGRVAGRQLSGPELTPPWRKLRCGLVPYVLLQLARRPLATYPAGNV
jgi:hypothetical protein